MKRFLATMAFAGLLGLVIASGDLFAGGRGGGGGGGGGFGGGRGFGGGIGGHSIGGHSVGGASFGGRAGNVSSGGRGGVVSSGGRMGSHPRLPNVAAGGRVGVSGTGGPRLPASRGRTGGTGAVLAGSRVTLGATGAATVKAGGGRVTGSRVTLSGQKTSVQVAGKGGSQGRPGPGGVGSGLSLTGGPGTLPQAPSSLLAVAQGYNQQLYNDLKAGNPLSQQEIIMLGTINQSLAKTNPTVAAQAGQAAAVASAYNSAVAQGNGANAGAWANAAAGVQGTIGTLAGLGGPFRLGGGIGRFRGGAGALPGIMGGMPTIFSPVDADDPDGAALVMSVDPGSVDAPADGQDDLPWQTSRYIRVANATDEKITLYLQVKTQNEDEDWVWFPAKPGADEALAFDLSPGQAAELTDGDWPINGSRIRVWAESKTRQYVAFRDKDLWLVPETNDEGYHGYEAADVQTFEVAIR